MLAALTQTTYTFQGDRLMLEPKDEIKVKLGYSPDEADAFVLTFAEPVTPIGNARPIQQSGREDYQPFAELDRVVRASYGNNSAVDANYDPYR